MLLSRFGHDASRIFGKLRFIWELVAWDLIFPDPRMPGAFGQPMCLAYGAKNTRVAGTGRGGRSRGSGSRRQLHATMSWSMVPAPAPARKITRLLERLQN